MEKPQRINLNLEKLGKEELYRHIKVYRPLQEGTMKSIGSLIASLTVVLAALLVIASPVSLRAAEAALYAPRETAAEEPVKDVQECPMVKSAASADCLSAGPVPEPDISMVMRKVTSPFQQSSALDDSSGALLENLVKRGPER
jgi:hypothetical protein